ncbi:unnamed protein product [Peniophora sp. CBMAI 1063]|nr:unnamed protein product [Peniophora sp. CBMAI 1063]
MYRFIDAKVSSKASFHSYLTDDTSSEPPPSPASGPVPRTVAENEHLEDAPRDVHLPGFLRTPSAPRPLNDALKDHVASFYPVLADILARRPRDAASTPDHDYLWVCPDCGYFFTPLYLGADEHSYLLSIAPHLEILSDDHGPRIDQSDYTRWLNYSDHFVYYHIAEAHLRAIGMFISYPNPEADYPAPATWHFVHDQPMGARSALAGGIGTDVERELDQIRRDLARHEAGARARLRAELVAKGNKAVKRALHSVSVRLTRWQRERRTERRVFVQELFSAGRSLIDVGRALVRRIHCEDTDGEMVGWMDEYYSIRRAYPEFIE